MGLKSYNEFIKTQKNLEDLLEGYGVETYSWGKNGSKTIADLFNEISKYCEIFIKDGNSLIRKVRADSIYVYYSYEIPNHASVLLRLKEIVRIRKNPEGEYRTENIIKKNFASSVGTELLVDEDPKEAARKCLREKLGFKAIQTLENERRYVKELSSLESYPGIKSIYEITEYDTFISSVDYRPDGYCRESNNKLSIWQWDLV